MVKPKETPKAKETPKPKETPKDTLKETAVKESTPAEVKEEKPLSALEAIEKAVVTGGGDDG